MSKNKKLLLCLGSSIVLLVLAFLIYLWCEKIAYENWYREDVFDIDEVSERGQNVIINIYGNGFLLPIDETYNTGYYVYADYELNRQVIVYMDNFTYNNCSEYGFGPISAQCELDGVAFNVDEKLNKEFTSFYENNEFIFEVNEQGVNLHTVYVDTTAPIVIKDDEFQERMLLICLISGVILFFISIILLIINNFSNIIAKKSVLLKWFFRLSFLPLGIIIMISMLMGFDDGFDSFLFCFLILGIILTVIPVLPIAFIYQIVYIIIYCRKRKKNNKNDVSTQV